MSNDIKVEIEKIEFILSEIKKELEEHPGDSMLQEDHDHYIEELEKLRAELGEPVA